MLTKVNTDMISNPSIVQSSEKLCEIFIALVSEVGARFEDSVECVPKLTTPHTCSPITTQMDPEYSNKYQSVDNCHISGDAAAKNYSGMNRLFVDG